MPLIYGTVNTLCYIGFCNSGLDVVYSKFVIIIIIIIIII